MAGLDVIQQHIAPELARMNEIIRETLATDNEMMNNIVTDYLRTKGKQIRPILVILSARMFGQINEDVLNAGASLEMLHNASLIHDDIVDETALRRGRPTINASWGNHIAVLVGDFFVSNALYAGIRTGSVSIISTLSNLGKELSLGEVDQICNARGHRFDEESYFSMIKKKTASLFMSCVRMGAETVGASREEIAGIEEYARLLGICFQIRDDIFDYFPNDLIGKPSGNDLREGKVTLPLLYALAHAPEAESREMKNLIIRGDLSSAEIARLVDFAIRNGGIEYSFETMRSLEREARAIIMRFPASQWRDAFCEIFDYIISREK